MRILLKQYSAFLYELASTTKKDNLKLALRGFVEMVARNQDLGRLPKILYFFNQFWLEKEMIHEVEVISAYPLAESVSARLQKIFFKGKTVFKYSIDPSLIGGVVVKYNNTLIDNTISHRLNLLRSVLTG